MPSSPLSRGGLAFGEEGDAISQDGTPGRIRTCDLRIRSPLLYPAELRAPDSATFPWRPIRRRRFPPERQEKISQIEIVNNALMRKPISGEKSQIDKSEFGIRVEAARNPGR